MFEFQVPHAPAQGDLSDEVRAGFRDREARLTGVSLLSWAEHCTECAAPACYASCDLYEARADKRCRRFAGGMSASRVPNLQGFAVRIAFKRWAQLMARGRVRLVAPRRARAVERVLHFVDRLVARIPDHEIRILGRTSLSARLAMRLKKWVAETRWLDASAARPDYFLVEVWNPAPRAVPLSLVLQNPPEAGRRPPFQRKLTVEPGMNRWKLDYAEIEPHLDLARELLVHLIPNILAPEEEGRVLWFGSLGFVADAGFERVPAPAPARHVKAVAWDLDGTLWDGVLLEDGPEGVKLRTEVAQVMAELDRRGIVQSVVSKNEPGDALAQLRRLGLEELFVFPKIGWGPKSESIAALLRDLNIGADALAFVDDSPFERAQVARAHPTLRVHTAEEAAGLTARPEFDPPRTAESSRRRQLYRDQERRLEAQARSSGDYEDFLRECEMKLVVHPAQRIPIERLHELIQRTNQLNFSGNRYAREELALLVADPRFEAFALECSDRFGDYGIVGFALLDRAGSRLVDLALSCRVQGKRVEHAFLGFLLERVRERGAVRLEALYRETARNREAGAVFNDLGFASLAPEDGARILGFELSRELPRQAFVDTRFAS